MILLSKLEFEQRGGLNGKAVEAAGLITNLQLVRS